MGSQLFGNDDEPIANINVTPFVDIILVVLIIFMVTTPIILKPSINVNLPKAASGAQTAPSLLNIVIGPTGNIMLNGSNTDESAIAAYVKELITKNPDAQAVISADKDVPHGKVIGVIDIVKASGINKFAISIDQK